MLALGVWLALVVALVSWVVPLGTPAAIAFGVAAPLLWITGLRSLALWSRARAAASRAATVASTVSPVSPASLRVALLYCVADDLDLAAISASGDQDLAVDVVVLDDSHEAATREAVDAAAAANGWTVVRRTDRRGFKAGNLNHGLSVLRGRHDAYVLCDSDVVLPGDFVRRSLPALTDPTVAVVQGLPTARPGATWFSRYFGALLRTHVSVTRAGREASGVVTLLGRGALVRAAALHDVGGVPETVAEDLALTVALRRRGWRLVNIDLEFAEDYPVDYRSFRTQLRKTTEGAVEFLRLHVRGRRQRRMRGIPVGEARDLVFEAALVPLTALAGAVALIAGTVLAAAGTFPPLWAGLVSGLAAAAPLLPEAIRRIRVRGLAAGMVFVGVGSALYASTMYVVLAAVLRVLLGRRAVFWITPKRAAGRDQVWAMLRAEVVLVPVLAAAAMLCSGAAAAAIAPVGALALALAFAAPAVVGVRRPEKTAGSAVAGVTPVPSPRTSAPPLPADSVAPRSRLLRPAGVGPRA